MRCTQLADLNRLKNTLLHVPKIVWIIIEDASTKTAVVSNFLSKSRIPYVHLTEKTINKSKPDNSSWVKHKGTLQRNKALSWLKNSSYENGVIYFADDDNVYDIKLFEEVNF